ncbi:hypothetical protein BD626DRAFT_482431 [Schizophyllum amplum]|uniref:Uncharacterized protein n=1 Tax=Schizophyllum amplum TaxID=97359 RepID=A0A550CV58_9AGAR|nr:hypothetical protein BD626DRAFT_482431 [Auriculariopsis ampla]
MSWRPASRGFPLPLALLSRIGNVSPLCQALLYLRHICLGRWLHEPPLSVFGSSTPREKACHQQRSRAISDIVQRPGLQRAGDNLTRRRPVLYKKSAYLLYVLGLADFKERALCHAWTTKLASRIGTPGHEKNVHTSITSTVIVLCLWLGYARTPWSSRLI